MEYKDIQEKALTVRELYRQKNKEEGNNEWDAAAYMQGFVGDVGDLSKLIMARNGLRYKDDVDDKIKHELADCLWSILVLADELDVDLEQAFCDTMEEIKNRF